MFKPRWDMRLTDKELLRYLASLKEPTSQKAIATALGCHENTVRKSIKRLDRIITAHGYGNRIPYRYSINRAELPDHLKAELD